MSKLEEVVVASYAFTRKDTARNVRLSFPVKAGYQALLFQFFYEPEFLRTKEQALEILDDSLRKYKIPEFAEEYPDPSTYLPLRNLLTLSVFAPEGYLGCAHRPDSKQEHFISEKESSRGFLPHPITAGRWEAVINVHCVVTERCNCSIRIHAFKEGETI